MALLRRPCDLQLTIHEIFPLGVSAPAYLRRQLLARSPLHLTICSRRLAALSHLLQRIARAPPAHPLEGALDAAGLAAVIQREAPELEIEVLPSISPLSPVCLPCISPLSPVCPAEGDASRPRQGAMVHGSPPNHMLVAMDESPFHLRGFISEPIAVFAGTPGMVDGAAIP